MLHKRFALRCRVPAPIRDCRQTGQLVGLFDRMVLHDPETAGHCLRVAAAVRELSEELGVVGELQTAAVLAAMFHDIGKTAVSKRIIRKEGLLTGKEYLAVKRHCQNSRRLLERIDWPPPLSCVPDVAGSHHERWDGSGYPLGLSGGQIPIGARMIAVVDTFDALTSRRRYRRPMAPQAAWRLVRLKRGTHFDPAISDAFFRRILQRGERRRTGAASSRTGCQSVYRLPTRTGTSCGPPRFAEDPERCRGIGSPRCR